MNRFAAVFLILLSALASRSLVAGDGDEECKEDLPPGKMQLMWVGENVDIAMFSPIPNNYVISFGRVPKIKMKADGQIKDVSLTQMIDLWPALAQETKDLNFTLMSALEPMKFRIWKVEATSSGDGLRAYASLESGESSFSKSLLSTDVTSEILPHIENVATLLVYYTASAMTAAHPTDANVGFYNILTKTLHRIRYMNQALANSRVPGRIRMVGFKPLAFREENLLSPKPDSIEVDAQDYLGSVQRTLQDPSQDSFEETRGQMKAERRNSQADLVTVITGKALMAGGSACGIGAIGKSKVSGVSVTRYRCLSPSDDERAFAHEIGHNFNLRHDRGVISEAVGADDSNFGYIDSTARFYTVMAYGTKCPSFCSSIPYYSTPDVSVRIGDKTYPVGDRQNNNAAMLKLRFPEVGAYHTKL